MRQEYARSAIDRLSRINTLMPNVVREAVQCVIDGGHADVYDLTVSDAHEFFANGILVHNCIDSIRYALDGMIKGKTSDWHALIS